MILVRRGPKEEPEQLELAEFERRARDGAIAPHHQVCFPAVTGTEYVTAGSLELYRGLFASGLLTFQRYFNLARLPALTLGMIGLLLLSWFGWQHGEAPASTERLVELGAKSPVLMIELGQWWRLLTANLVHVSGWHVAVNAVFLFNLGGPAEAIFRRLDTVVILVASALGTTLVSTLANPAVSCGASGIVFGVWGAAAVFGMRHRELLPDRYRRYFIGVVVPYAIVALYLGFAMPGVDNWGHLGGLMAGAITALFLPSRLLAPRDRLAPAKLLALGAVALLIAAAGQLKAGPGELLYHRYYPHSGLALPIPMRWRTTVSERLLGAETFAFDNRAGVSVALQARRLQRPAAPEGLGRRFVEGDLARQLERAGVSGIRIHEPEPARLADMPAERIDTLLRAPGFIARATYVVAVRGYYQYVVSFTAPDYLAQPYARTFTDVLAGADLQETDELVTARRRLAAEDTPVRHARLAIALAHAGRADEAWQTLDDALERWQRDGALSHAAAGLLYESGQDPERACELAAAAVDHGIWTPSMVRLAIDIYIACGRWDAAADLSQQAVEMYPDDPDLRERHDAVVRP